MADPFNLPEDDFLLAGELSLEVLDGESRAAARRRQLSDADFAAAVAWWDERLARMTEAVGEIAPSPDLLQGIHAAIDRAEAGNTAPDTMVPSRSRPAPWSMALAALGTAMAAAALVLFLATPVASPVATPPGPAVSGAQLVAQLQDLESGRRLASVIDTDARRLAVRTAGLDAGAGRIAELWVIPEGGSPRSLGAIPASGTFERGLSAEEAQLLGSGSSLAVTFEQDDGVRHQAPTMPILLVGPLDEV